MRQKFPIYAQSGVGHAQDRFRTFYADTRFDASALRSELDRIAEQVPDDLLQPIGIAEDDCRFGPDVDCEVEVLRFKSGTHALSRSLKDRAELGFARLQTQISGDHPRHVEQIVDQLRLRARIALDDVERPDLACVVELSAAQQLRPAEYRIERGA